MQWKELSLYQRTLLAAGVCALILIAYWIGILQPVLSLTAPLFAPISKQMTKVGIDLQKFNTSLFNLGKLREENVELRKQNNELLAEHTRLKEIEHENEYLLQQLDLKKTHDYDLVPAHIIGKEPTNFIQFLIIDQGTDQGIQKNMPVVSSEGLLVGQVVSTQAHSSKVLIITDGDSVIPAKLQNARVDGVVRGQSFGYGMIMEFIPLDAPVKKNDVVITSGLGGIFPKGIFIGVVNTVESNPSDLFQQAVVRPQINFNQLELVAVIKKAPEELYHEE